MRVYVTPHEIECCFSKRHHPTAAKARKVIKRRSGKRDHPVEVYQCPVCLDWCLGGKHHKTTDELAVEEVLNLWTFADYNYQPTATT